MDEFLRTFWTFYVLIGLGALWFWLPEDEDREPWWPVQAAVVLGWPVVAVVLGCMSLSGFLIGFHDAIEESLKRGVPDGPGNHPLFR